MLSLAELAVVTLVLIVLFGIAAVIGFVLISIRQGHPHQSQRSSERAVVSDPSDVPPFAGRTPERIPQEQISRDGPELHALLEIVFNQIDDAVVVVDRGGRRLFENTAAVRLRESRDGGLLVDGAIRDLLTSAVGGETLEQEVDVFGPPQRSFLISVRPLADGDGPGAFAIAEDVTVRRRTDSVRRDFVANISHELKSPVAAMGLLADMIDGETDPEVVDRLSTRMVHEAERMSATIDDLLSLANIEFAEDARFDDAEITEIVLEVMERVRPAADRTGISVVPRLEVQGTVSCDRRQLVSAVHNLVDNAIKYSPPGGKVDLEIRRSDPEGMVEFTVRDDGPGIPRHDQDRIFERFYRVDRARSRETGGTGLGLAIVRHVADNHGGEVTVDSREGAGSTFVLRVPQVSPGTLG